MNLKSKMCVCWWLLSLVIASPVARGQLKPEVESILKGVDQKTPGLGDEIRQLASTSANAMRLLEIYFADGMQRPEDYPTSAAKLADLWKWGGFASAAYQAADSDFGKLLAKYPLITRESRLLGDLKNVDGQSVLISAPLTGSRFDSHGRFVPANEIVEVSVVDVGTGRSLGFVETQAQDFKVVRENSKDSLALITWSRGSSLTHTQEIVTQTYRVTKKGSFELIEKNSAIVPWPRNVDKELNTSSSQVSPMATNGGEPTQTATTNADAPLPTIVPKSPATTPTASPRNPINSTTPWAIGLVIIVAATGLLWLVLTRRAKGDKT
jgi:hypothetical protein